MAQQQRTVGVLAVAFVAATVWFFTTKKHETKEAPQSISESVQAGAIAAAAEQSPLRTKDESIRPQVSTEERVAAVKHTLALAMTPERDGMAETLVARGLSRADAEQAGQRFVEGYADCLFEAARQQYDAQGMGLNEFLDRTETAWTQILTYINNNKVRSAMVPCMANISQQTGIPLPANFGSVGTPDEQIAPPPPPPAWAAEMDGKIRDYVASRPDLGVAAVLTECTEEGCSVMLVGRDIRIFEFEFDVFAEQNGFQKAVLRGDANRRLVWLER